MTTTQRSLIYSPQALALLRQGFDTLAAPLALTLGPTQGVIVNARSKDEPELLTDSGTIARRVVDLPGRGNNLGAMMLRNMVLGLHDQLGDGAAIATVIARSMLREGAKLIAAGANTTLMRHGIDLAVDAALEALKAQGQPITGQEALTALASGVTGDPHLAEILGEMFEILGENAAIITQEEPRPDLDREYVKGGKWDGYIPSQLLIPEGNEGLVLHYPLVLSVDEPLKTLEQVQPILEQTLAMPDKPPLLLIAREISDVALATLVTNHVRGVLNIGLFVLSTGVMQIEEDFNDIAILTGGQALIEATGRTAQQMQPRYFGRAERAVITHKGVVIANGAGDKQTIKQRIAELRAQAGRLERTHGDWERTRLRVARLSGGIGVLKIGAYSESEREVRKEKVQKALRVLESAYEYGVAPGGGVAYLNCIPALQKARAACKNDDERLGVMIVEVALKAPFLQIVRNHGKVHPPVALAQVQRLGPGYGFDALQGDYTCMVERHILDSVSVLRGVLRTAASIAAMIMTTDTIVFTNA